MLDNGLIEEKKGQTNDLIEPYKLLLQAAEDPDSV